MAETTNNGIKIAVCGSTGADRFSICNGLIGEELLQQNSEVVQIVPWRDEVNQVSVEVTSIATFDNTQHNIETYRQEVRKVKNKEFDLMLYCLPVNPARPVIKEDQKAYDELKRILHPSTWEHCVVVLTYAEAIVKNGQTKYNSKDKMTRRIVKDYDETIKSWTVLVREAFGENTPVIPAGSSHCFSILENDEFWLSKLFSTVITIMNDNAIKTLHKKNCHRLCSKIMNKDDLLISKFSEHPIIIGAVSKNMNAKLKEVAAGLGAGGAAGAVGATIGATIGALAIGIPSFGVAAGAGLVLGAAIGGGIGIGTGVGVTKAVQNGKRKKLEEEEKGLI